MSFLNERSKIGRFSVISGRIFEGLHMLTSSASLSFGSTDGRTCWWNSDVHVCGTMGIYGMLTYCQWQRPSVQETFKCFLDWFYFCFVGTSIYLWFCKFCLCWSFSIIETGIVVYRAFARVGNAYQKKEDFSNALLYYNKSLSEHRDSEIVKKAQEVSMIAILFFCTATLFHIINLNILSILVTIEVTAIHM